MADNKKYYYMRLKENFFDDENIKILEAMPDGYLYSNILLKMYLISLKSGGNLMLNNVIPYDCHMIASVTRHQVGTVEKALKLFVQMALIEILDDGQIYMLNIQNYIGVSTTEADRQRDYDRRRRLEREQIPEKQPAAIEAKEPDPETTAPTPEEEQPKKARKKKEDPPKHKYGEYGHVLLTDEELERLNADFGSEMAKAAVDYLDAYIEEKGYKSKSHNLAIRRWVISAVNERKGRTQTPGDKITNRVSAVDNW